jgi:gluconolactonase
VTERQRLGAKADILASGLGWPEGPVVTDDGAVIFVETFRSRLSRWEPSGRLSTYAHTGGGPNAVTLGADGCLYVTQNGGIVGPWHAKDRRTPSIQRVAPDGTIDAVVTSASGRPLRAPNDLAFGRDGALYFTDPGGSYDPVNRPDPGWLCRADGAGQAEILCECGHTFPNGIAAEADGCVVWVESYTRAVRRLRTDGSIELVRMLPEPSVPDGLAIAASGDLYITATRAGGIDVVSPDGGAHSFIRAGVVPTNCAFSGTDLIITDGGGLGLSGEPVLEGKLIRLRGTGAAGQDLFRGSL